MPLFLTNRDFRKFLLVGDQKAKIEGVKYSRHTVDFWLHEFKEEQMQPIMVRVRRLLSGTYQPKDKRGQNLRVMLPNTPFVVNRATEIIGSIPQQQPKPDNVVSITTHPKFEGK